MVKLSARAPALPRNDGGSKARDLRTVARLKGAKGQRGKHWCVGVGVCVAIGRGASC